MALKSHALQHGELCCSILIVAVHRATYKKQPSPRPMEWQIRVHGWRWEEAEVEIAATSGSVRSDLWQISVEMSGVHPVVTLTGDSSAVLEFNLRSTTR